MKLKTCIPGFKTLTYRLFLNMCNKMIKYGNCKIYDFEQISMRFVYIWHIEKKLFLTLAEKTFICLGIRKCIILCYRNFLTRWENLHCEN